MIAFEMHAGWNFVITLLVAFPLHASAGFWPFKVNASPDIPQHVYSDANAKRIAIVGAGAAGASTAYHLQKFADQSGLTLNITVFEKSSFVGGRSRTVNAYGNPLEPVELGASIFVEVNAILKNASEIFGLKPKQSKETDDVETLGIWNGQVFVYTQKSGGWKYWDIAKMLWKYGLSPIRTQNLMKSTVGKFLKLYEAPFFPFRSLSERAIDLGLVEITSMTGQQLLEANNIGAAFSTDIIQASTRVNYAQNLNLIHGLETMVCMAIDGAMQIEGGNWQIFDGMLNAANATILLNTTVNGLTKQNGKYNLKTSSQSLRSGETYSNEEPFDTVVLAAPLQFSKINIEKGLLKHTPDKIPYVTLHVTLFSSSHTLDPTFFNLEKTDDMPTTILTTLPSDEAHNNPEDGCGSPGFFSISILRTAINPKTSEREFLYKIFSPKKVTSDFLSGILGTPIPEDLSTINISSGDAITWYYPHIWYSYPYEYPRVTFEDSELARGLYYTSGMESFISTMETSALMGMNVAQLIVDDYLQLQEDQKSQSGGSGQVIFSEKERISHGEEL